MKGNVPLHESFDSRPNHFAAALLKPQGNDTFIQIFICIRMAAHSAILTDRSQLGSLLNANFPIFPQSAKLADFGTEFRVNNRISIVSGEASAAVYLLWTINDADLFSSGLLPAIEAQLPLPKVYRILRLRESWRLVSKTSLERGP